MQIEKLWKLKGFHGFFYLLPFAKSRKGVDFCLCILYNALANRNRTSPKIQRTKGRPPVKKLSHFSKGMGIGGWLTNYKRLAMLPENKRFVITDGDLEHFDTYITENDVKNIASMGFDHIRLGFDQIVLESEPYVYRDHIFELIERFAAWCETYDVRLILNMHKALGSYCDVAESYSLFDSEELQNRFTALWVEFERRFSGRPDIMFELLNEVRDVKPELWNNLYLATIKALRAVSPTRDIIVGTICWNSASALKHLVVLEDDEHVHYTFHIYDPFEFTHQRCVLNAQQLFYNRALSYPCDDMDRYRDYYRIDGRTDPYPADMKRMDKNYLRKVLQGAVDFVAAHPDKILWCGEFGTIRHTDLASRINWMRDVISICKEYDMPYSVWNYLSTPNDGNRFSLMDDDRREVLSKELLDVLLGK